MSYDEEYGYRKSIRLPFYDYSSGGFYFVTLCTSGWESIFGHVENGEMILSEFGQIVESAWYGIPQHFSNVDLDVFVVMPNHVHGVIVIKEEEDIQQLTRAQHAPTKHWTLCAATMQTGAEAWIAGGDCAVF